MSTPKDSPSLSGVPRIIPGFNQPQTSAPKPRKRGSKKGTAASSVGPQTTGLVEPVQEESQLVGGVTEEGGDGDLVKRTNAVEQTKKRLRAQNKKLQRLDAYEAKADINEDQRRALAGRGTIDAVVKELNELLAILEAEEKEDEEREKRVSAAQEKKQARAVEAAVEASKSDAQSQLVLLCQFLHLRALYSPSQPSAFAPPVLPPIVAQATGQEVAAVHSLFDELSNGPLLGGHGDALEKISKIATGSEDHVIEGVTFSRIQELIHGLTAAPEPVSTNDTPMDSPVLESSSAPGPADSVVALVDGEKEAHSSPSFLNESEIEPASLPDDKVATWAGEIADSAQAPPPSGPATPTADILSFTDSADTPSTEIPSPISNALNGNGNEGETLSAVTPPAAVQEQPTLDWAADEEGGGELPSLPELAPAVPIVSQQAEGGQQVPQGDGFQSARPSRRGNGYRGGPRGGGPGGEGGQRRGSFRGGRGEGRGRGNGGGGRGARGGRGRGGAAPNPTVSATEPSA